MNQIRVALIEDHDLTRIGIRTALQQSGQVQVVGEATNAADGLKLLQQTRPDVAIVDVGLPDMDGIELTRWWKKSLGVQAEKEPKTKMLILTLQDNKAAVLAAFAAGVDSYCLKDRISPHDLLKVLQVIHRGGAWIDPVISHIVLEQSRNGQLKSNNITRRVNTVTINMLPSEHRQLLAAAPLTRRQLEILELIVAGYSNQEIAQQLYITIGTAKTHVRDILNKLCADDRTQAAVCALRAGLVS